MDRWHRGQASLPFLRGGVSRSSLSDTRPLTANEKDPSAPLGMTIREEHFSSARFIRYSGYPSPTLSFRAQREIFLALCSFLLLSQKVSPFPLSHIRHYPLLQERSLDFARDDDTGNSVFQTYPLYATRNKPIPPYRHFEHSEKSSLHSALSCSFRKRFPLFRCHTYDAIPVCKKDPSASLGMTIQE